MVTLFYVLLALSIWHFLYESILAEVFKKEISYQFFELRDELRSLDHSEYDKQERDLYEVIDRSLCNAINSMPAINFRTIHHLKKIERSSPNFREELLRTRQLFQTAKNQELMDIKKSMDYCVYKTILVNTGGWMPYALIPFLLILLFDTIFGVIGRFKQWFKTQTSGILYVQDLDDTQGMGLA